MKYVQNQLQSVLSLCRLQVTAAIPGMPEAWGPEGPSSPAALYSCPCPGFPRATLPLQPRTSKFAKQLHVFKARYKAFL